MKVIALAAAYLLNIEIVISKVQTNVYSRIALDGYKLEVHNVTTDDGYILELHRIPGENQSILLQHALGGSSDNFILNGPGEALAYALSDAGYDVWLGNNRGNVYSRNHTTLSPEHYRFWNFSFHEMAVNDIPAMIDYILLTTEQSSLHYIGHSQGATTLLILLSEKPEYKEFIGSAYLLAPLVYISHTTSFLPRIMNPMGTSQPDADKRFSFEFGARNELVSQFSDRYCHENQSLSLLCELTIDALAGFDSKNFNRVSPFALFLESSKFYFPSGFSMMQIVHFLQLFRSGKFRQFDWGRVRNLEAYGSRNPRDYNLENATIPIAVFYSNGDAMLSKVDVELLLKKLPNVVMTKYFDDYQWNHLDYLMASTVQTDVNDVIIDSLNKL